MASGQELAVEMEAVASGPDMSGGMRRRASIARPPGSMPVRHLVGWWMEEMDCARLRYEELQWVPGGAKYLRLCVKTRVGKPKRTDWSGSDP